MEAHQSMLRVFARTLESLGIHVRAAGLGLPALHAFGCSKYRRKSPGCLRSPSRDLNSADD